MDDDTMPEVRLVIDTNVFVGAGFSPGSHSAAILQRVERGEWVMVWNRRTRSETRAVLTRVPPLSWERVEPLFRPEHEFAGPTYPERYTIVDDPDDREFAALAAATGAVVVSSDEHLLGVREWLDVPVLTPGELMNRYGRRRREEE